MRPDSDETIPVHPRDFDVPKSFRHFVYPAIGVYFIITMGSMVVLDPILDPSAKFAALFVIGLSVGGVTLGGAIRIQKRQMKEAGVGYNVQDGSKPMFVVGSREYTRYRIDNGLYPGRTRGYDPVHENLHARQREQRELDCDVCHTTIGHGGGYFVETRTIYRLCGFRVWERITDVAAYCPTHKPRDFK